MSRIAVVGCGAMGSLYAGLLAAGGHHVTAVHRGAAHVQAIRRDGLRIDGPGGARTVRLHAVTTPPHQAMDLVVVAVKAAQVDAAGATLAPLLGEHTVVLTLQNGIGSADVLARHVDPDRLAVGIAAGFGAMLHRPGHVQHAAMQRVRLGAHRGLPDAALQALAAAWRAGGFDTEVVQDVVAMQWDKLVCNVAYSAPCALSGLTVGEVMDHPDLGPVSRAAAQEAWEVARALGIAVDATDPVAQARAFGQQVRDARPSMLQDLAAGRPTEIDVIHGAVPTAAARLGRPAPVNATLAALVRQRERSLALRKD